MVLWLSPRELHRQLRGDARAGGQQPPRRVRFRPPSRHLGARTKVHEPAYPMCKHWRLARGALRPPLRSPRSPALRRSSRTGLAPLSLLPARPDGRSPHRRRLRVSPAELDDLAGQGRGRRPCRCLLRCGRPWRARGRGPPRRPRLSASAPAKSRASAATSTRPPAGPTPTPRQPRPSPP